MSFLCTDCKTTCICGWVPVCVCANLNPVNLAFAFVFMQNVRTPLPATLFLFIVRLFGRKIIVITYLNWTSYCKHPPHSLAIHEFTNAFICDKFRGNQGLSTCDNRTKTTTDDMWNRCCDTKTKTFLRIVDC